MDITDRYCSCCGGLARYKGTAYDGNKGSFCRECWKALGVGAWSYIIPDKQKARLGDIWPVQ